MEPTEGKPPAKRPKGTPIGENAFFSRDGNIGRIEFDLSYRGGRSATGKSVRVISTMGNHSLPEFPAIVLGMNGYEKP